MGRRMTFVEKTALTVVAVAVIAFLLSGLLFPWLWRPNWVGAELNRRAGLIDRLGMAMEEYEQSHGGKLPDTLEDLIAASPERITADEIERDRRGNQVLARAVYLRNVRDAKGANIPWVILVLVPRGGLLDPLPADYIRSEGLGRSGGSRSLRQAERDLGHEIVEAVYRKDRENRAATTTHGQ